MRSWWIYFDEACYVVDELSVGWEIVSYSNIDDLWFGMNLPMFGALRYG